MSKVHNSIRAALAVSTIGALGAVAACGTASPSESSTATSREPSALTATRMPTPQGTVGSRFPCEGVPVNKGGHLMTGGISIVPIFYGTAWQAGYQATILTFLQSMSQTSYWQVVEEYTDKATGGHPGAVTVGSATNITDYRYGKTLTNANIQQLAQDTITQTGLGASAQQIYMVFTADDVDQYVGNGQALCSSYLGWHEQGTFTFDSGGQDPRMETVTSQYAFVGSDQFCINNPQIQGVGCIEGDAGPGPSAWDETSNGSGPPNGAVTDIGITAAMHEAAEAATDPAPGTGVYPEIGDICAWEPGPLTFWGSPGFYVNTDLGTGEPYASTQKGYAGNVISNYSFLVQTLWDINQNACAYGPAALDGPVFHYTPCPACRFPLPQEQ